MFTTRKLEIVRKRCKHCGHSLKIMNVCLLNYTRRGSSEFNCVNGNIKCNKNNFGPLKITETSDIRRNFYNCDCNGRCDNTQIL